MGVALATYPGAPDGMRRDLPQHQIPDTALWTLIDGWIRNTSDLERRKAVSEVVTKYSTASQAAGLFGTANPAGTWVGCYLMSRDSDNLGRIVGFENSTMDTPFGFDPAQAPPTIFDSKGSLKGGVLVGAASSVGAAPTSQCLLLYKGATLGVGTSRTLTAPIGHGDTTFSVTAGGTDFTPGGFVFDTSSGVLIGEVKSVATNTITLVDPSIGIGTDEVTVRPFRRLLRRVSKGRITTASTSDVVNGGLTQFRKLGLDSGVWVLYTTDWTYIGTVSGVSSDTQLVLTSTASVDLLNADFIAINETDADDLTTTPFGIINAVHAGHQFYARGAEVMWSDDDDREAVDDIDDTLSVSADDITGMTSTLSSLLIHTTHETWALSGATGTLPDRWRGDRMLDDGALNPMVCQTYKNGAIWAGSRGIYFWGGGGDPQVISAGLGEVYERLIKSAQDNTGFWSALTRDHYLMFLEDVSDQADIKIACEATIDDDDPAALEQPGEILSSFCIAVNLETGAISLLTNIGIQGYVRSVEGQEFIATTAVTSGSASGRATVFDAAELWWDDVTSAVTDVMVDVHEPAPDMDTTPLWPQFSLETRKYDFGNPQILKLIKLFLLHYKLGGTNDSAAAITAGTADSLRFATVKGLQTVGAVAGKKLYPVPANGDTEGQWQDKRVKFMKRSQFLSMRIWQGTSTIANLRLGAWALGFKQKRPGRV